MPHPPSHDPSPDPHAARRGDHPHDPLADPCVAPPGDPHVDHPPDPLAALRGPLPPATVGARGLEKLARNPRCARLRALTLARVSPAHVAARLGQRHAEGQSPFAIQLGLRFERRLLEDGAARLVERLQADGVLPPGAMPVAEVPPAGEAGPGERVQVTLGRLAGLLGSAADPHLILHPALALRALGGAYLLELDALCWDGARLFPIEIKSYAARGPLTDPADLRSAARQCAVYVLALRAALKALGVADAAGRVPAEADLILRAPGSLAPVRLPIALEAEVAAIERALAGGAGLDDLLHDLPLGATLDDPDVVAALPRRYRDSCGDHCALAPCCKAEALLGGDLSVLGDGAARALAAAGSIPHALALVRGAEPRDEAEAALQEELARVSRELEEGGVTW